MFSAESVETLWKSLDSIPPQYKYNCNYPVPIEIDKFIDCFNALSSSAATKEEVLKEVSHIPQFEMMRLCKLVKDDMFRRNPKHTPTDKFEFEKSRASINYIALQEGVLPPTLYMICAMNFSK